MNPMKTLQDKPTTIGIIGLGYVGLPLHRRGPLWESVS